jgi:hypothetical protein
LSNTYHRISSHSSSSLSLGRVDWSVGTARSAEHDGGDRGGGRRRATRASQGAPRGGGRQAHRPRVRRRRGAGRCAAENEIRQSPTGRALDVPARRWVLQRPDGAVRGFPGCQSSRVSPGTAGTAGSAESPGCASASAPRTAAVRGGDAVSTPASPRHASGTRRRRRAGGRRPWTSRVRQWRRPRSQARPRRSKHGRVRLEIHGRGPVATSDDDAPMTTSFDGGFFFTTVAHRRAVVANRSVRA